MNEHGYKSEFRKSVASIYDLVDTQDIHNTNVLSPILNLQIQNSPN